MAASSSDINVTYQDQQDINTFGRLNATMHEKEDEMQQMKQQLENLEDASSEIALADGPQRFYLGETFFEMTPEEVTERLDQSMDALKERARVVTNELDTIKATMTKLKERLYGKFGSAINLDE